MSIITAVILIGEANYFESRFKLRSELINEVLVMFMLYSMIVFSPFVPDLDARFKMGYFCCFVETIAIGTNVYLIL